MTDPPGRSAGSQAPARVVYFGSGAFALPPLRALVDDPRVDVIAVVAPPDRPAGRRGTSTSVPVATEARRLGLLLLQPERIRTPESTARIADLEPDLGVLADFGRIVPQAILELPSHGILNIHPSLLPHHRGATPVAATILDGDLQAGVSIMVMDAGLDTGPVLATRSWPLLGNETTPEIEARAADAGAALLTEVLGPYLQGGLTPVPQDEAAATLTRPLRRGDGRLDPRQAAERLERQVRAYQPWPGAFIETTDGRLAVARAAVAPGDEADRAGEIVADGDGLALTTAEGRLRLIEVQPAGGRLMPASDYRRGHPAVIGPLMAGVA